MRRTVMGVVFLVLLQCSSARAEPSAEEVLKGSGFQGGLIVHLGCGEGKLTAALRASAPSIVQGLDTDATSVDKARAHFRSLGLDGSVTAAVFDGRRLPYVDNLVNLLVAEDLGDVAGAEVNRVLAPGGVACVKTGDRWTRTVKPWPAEIDDWPHYLHGPDNNAVAEDSVVGPPRHFQWISEPRFARSHDHLASVSAVVSAGGRLFYIVDTGSIAFAGASPRWRLVARDAFNGVRLWERDISSWEYHLRDFRSGPADLARRLVAVGDRVYVTLGYGEPVVALDARTGETVRTYADTEGTQEILHDQGTLFLVLGKRKLDWRAQEAKQIVSQPGYSPPFENYTPPVHEKRLMAVDADAGEVVWQNSEPYARDAMPSTLAVSGKRVYFQNAEAVVCLDATNGRLAWEAPRPAHRKRLAWSTPTLVVHDGVVFSADRGATDTEGELLWIPSGGYHQYIQGEDVKGELIAFDGETGKQLWSCPAYEGFNAPVDVIIADGLVWTGRYAWGNDPGITEARDPRTGEVLRRRPPDSEFLPRMGHARCHRAKATSECLILGRRGVEFVDLESGHMVGNFWLRGICQYGVMPANGLLYVPPHSCVCSVGDMLKNGFAAFAPAREENVTEQPAPAAALERGPAVGFAPRDRAVAAQDSWPTYRRDQARSGATPTDVSPTLQAAWTTDLGEKLTSPVVADGMLLVAETDAHRIHALNAATGEPAWSFTAGARIDSSPTIHEGRVLFGSADGHVYCLRLEDGALVWRFRAAPSDRRIVVDEQLESPWPVPGNVLVLDGAAYFSAGRNAYVDGGMFLYKLDAATGETFARVELGVEEDKRNSGFAGAGCLPDVLSSDGESIFMRSARFDLDLARQKSDVAHLWSPVGFLDDRWWHRTYWQIGTTMKSGWGGWPKAGQEVPAGRLLVTDGASVFGFGRNQYDTPGAHVGVDADGVWGPIGRKQGRWTFYHLFRRALDLRSEKQSRRQPRDEPQGESDDWTRDVPVLVRAMVLADEVLFVAGPSHGVSEVPREPSASDPLAEALGPGRAGRLLAISTKDGKTLADYPLASPPVFDGMAAARGCLYFSTNSGKVVCMGPVR